MRHYTIAISIAAACFVSATLLQGAFRARANITCTVPTTVVEIKAVHYRTADILLSNGETVSLSQVTLKPGDSYCAHWSNDDR